MARKPNYSFERHERDRAAADGPSDDAPAAPDPEQV